jgi:hypothetical protein
MATQTDYHVAISPERVGALTATIDAGAQNVNFTTGRYWHLNLSTADLHATGALATSINTSIGATAHSVVCTYNAANGTYTLAGGGNFSATLGPTLADALGLATSLSAAASYTSTKRPLYLMRPLITAHSQESDDYVPPGTMRARMADDGSSQYAISPLGVPTYRDWVQPCERDTPLFDGGTYVGGAGHAMMRRNVTATMPWSWQHFWDTVRCEELFAWCSQTSPPTAATADVYFMRQEAGSFKPSRITPDYGLWDLHFAALLVGSQ